MIEVLGLAKAYGDREALRDVSFTIRPGEAVAYLGPNGAGKSTTVKILCGLLRPDRGQARIGGHDIALAPLEAKRQIGYVPDHAKLYETLTPNEYLSLVAELHGLAQPVAASRIGEMFRAFELDSLANKAIETLSRGQRQKVVIAAALVHDPAVLLLDEPLNGLDVTSGLLFRTIMQELLARGKTILFCSHILELAERLCGRTIVIDKGVIVADAPTRELLKRTPSGTLEAAFRQLTKPDQADADGRAVVEALKRA